MGTEPLEIPISYKGRDAERHEIELISLGQSLQGAGKLIRSAAQIVIPAQRASRIRVMTAASSAASYDIVALVIMAQPVLPFLEPVGKRAIEAIVNYMIAKFMRATGADRSMELAQTAVQEMGLTTRAAIEAIAKVSESARPAAKLFLNPVGDSCLTVEVGQQINGALVFDRADRDAIENELVDIGAESKFSILISELDLQNRTCKFTMRGDAEDRRYAGSITDPSIAMTNNHYTLALAQKRWLDVTAKPEMSEGDISRLYISDSAL